MRIVGNVNGFTADNSSVKTRTSEAGGSSWKQGEFVSKKCAVLNFYDIYSLFLYIASQMSVIIRVVWSVLIKKSSCRCRNVDAVILFFKKKDKTYPGCRQQGQLVPGIGACWRMWYSVISLAFIHFKLLLTCLLPGISPQSWFIFRPSFGWENPISL